MSRLEIVCMSDVRAELVEFLQAQGLVHMETVPVEQETDDGVVQSELVDQMELEGDSLGALTLYEDLDRTLQEIAPLLTEQPNPAAVSAATGTLAGTTGVDLAETVEGWADRLRSDSREKIRLQDTIDVLTNYQTILEQIAPSLGSNVKLGKGSRALVLNGNVDPVVETLKARLLEELGGDAHFHYSKPNKRSVVGLVTFPEEHGETVSRILSQEGVAPVDLKEDDPEEATAQEVLAKVRATLQNAHSTLGEVNSRLRETSKEVGGGILGAQSIVADELAQLRVQRGFGQTNMLTVMHGWIPQDQLGDLRHAVNEKFHGQVTVSELDMKDVPHHRVPTQLRNPAIFRPFELVMKLFNNPPTYGSIDPTPLIAVSFTVFYGFIVGDAFYGLTIMAFFWWLTNKFKHIPAMADVRKIGFYMGGSTIFFGVLYGEYGGEWLPVPDSLILFHRSHYTTDLLIYALYLGIIHVLLALGLGIYENWRHNHMTHAIERLGSMLGLLAIIIFVMNYFGVGLFASGFFLVLSGLLLVVGAALIFYAMGPMMGAIGVLELTSLGGNVMSYARLMALGVAAIAIANIANTMPEQMGPVLGVPMAIFIHIVNILISIASPTIHAMRLNVVEFLPKFFEPNGTGYSPFKKEIQS